MITVLRSATAEDFEAVASLLQQVDLPVDGLDDQLGPSYFVAVEGDLVVGVGGVERYGAVGLLRSIAVRAEGQSKSTGRQIVEQCLNWSRTNGLDHLYLLTTTAAKYFKRFGFEVVERDSVPDVIKRTSEFAAVCPENATVMRLVFGTTDGNPDKVS